MKFEVHDIRRFPVSELKRQKNYMNLMPRPSQEDYERLKERIKSQGMNPALPIVVNEDLVVLDGHTRLQIAQELGVEWVWCVTLDLGDHLAEKEFVIFSNLERRHLTAFQKGECANELLEIERERARRRQQAAGEMVGKNNLKQYSNKEQNKGDGHSHQLVLNEEQAGTQGEGDGHQLVPNSDQAGTKGRTLAKVAKKVGLGKDTLYRLQKIQEAARTDPEIRAAYEAGLRGEASVHQVYKLVQLKEQEKKKPQYQYSWEKPVPYTDEELRTKVLYRLLDAEGIPREVIDGTLARAPSVMWIWRWWARGDFDPPGAWYLTRFAMSCWLSELRATLPEETPLPPEAEMVGRWGLDLAHYAEMSDLLESFPPETAHLIYTDAVIDAAAADWWGRFGARALTKGRYLCVYVDKGDLPEIMACLSAHGFRYFWLCAVFRLEEQERKIGDVGIKERYRLLLIMRKSTAGIVGQEEVRRLLDVAHRALYKDFTPPPGELINWRWFGDAVLTEQPTNRDLVREVVYGLTQKGHLVVDPAVGTGITAQVARSMGRRFLGFTRDKAEAYVVNQRLAKIKLVAHESDQSNG